MLMMLRMFPKAHFSASLNLRSSDLRTLLPRKVESSSAAAMLKGFASSGIFHDPREYFLLAHVLLRRESLDNYPMPMDVSAVPLESNHEAKQLHRKRKARLPLLTRLLKRSVLLLKPSQNILQRKYVNVKFLMFLLAMLIKLNVLHTPTQLKSWRIKVAPVLPVNGNDNRRSSREARG